MLCLLPRPIRAAHVTLIPVADTFVMSIFPDHSAGGAQFFNSGTTQNLTSNRALLRFAVASSVPSNSVVTSVNLVLNLIKESGTAPQPSVFGLHRLLRPWGEGTNASVGGQGTPAGPGDTTWLARFFGTPEVWAVPGGFPGLDYSASFSSSAFLSDPAPYLFESTSDSVADVQFWLDQPESDAGWILISESEDVPMTAKQFASRENVGSEPQLAIDYLARPTLAAPRPLTNCFVFSFLAEPGQAYTVECATNLPASVWTMVLNLPPPLTETNVVVADPLTSGPVFYRVATQ